MLGTIFQGSSVDNQLEALNLSWKLWRKMLHVHTPTVSIGPCSTSRMPPKYIQQALGQRQVTPQRSWSLFFTSWVCIQKGYPVTNSCTTFKLDVNPWVAAWKLSTNLIFGLILAHMNPTHNLYSLGFVCNFLVSSCQSQPSKTRHSTHQLLRNSTWGGLLLHSESISWSAMRS